MVIMSNNMQKEQVVGEIKVTRDYSVFKLIKGNRTLNKRNFAKLVSSMKEKQLIIPILVNKNMEVIDGQHRLEVEKELNLPVYYYVQEDYGIEEVKRANMVSSTWTKEDFLDMHITEGKESYIEIKRLLDESGINLSDILKAFSIVQDSNVDIIAKQFEDGTFKIEGIDAVESFLIALKDFNEFEFYNTRQFVRAFMKLFFEEAYDHEKMVGRIAKRKTYITKRSTIDDYLVMLTREVYSFGAVKTPLFYDPHTKTFYGK